MYTLNKTKFLEPDELRLLERTLIRPSRDSLLLTLALRTGARAEELLNIEKIHLSDTNQSVLILGLKGSSDREIPLKPSLYRSLKNYALTHTSEFLFPISYSRLVQIWHLYRPVKKKFHSLRHTFAVELFKRTKDLKLVQLALGHKSLNTTQVYLDYIYKINEMKRLLF